MTKKIDSASDSKTSTPAISDLSPSKTTVTQVRGGLLRTIDGESTTKDHKG